MKEIEINRVEALKSLENAMVAVDVNRRLMQSDTFVFYKGNLITFNGEMRTIQTSPFGEEFEGSILAQDLLAVFKKFPDEKLKISEKEGELVVCGEERQAGVKTNQEILLPFKTVPKAKKYKTISPNLIEEMLQASLICRRDDQHWEFTCVHVDAHFVEGCDGCRYFRSEFDTGLETPILIQAAIVKKFAKFDISEIDISSDGWVHFSTGYGFEVSVIMNKSEYFKRSVLDNFLEMPDGKEVYMPQNLDEILSRAEIMSETENASVDISVTQGEVSVFSQKKYGWFKEMEKVKYEGPAFSFSVNPTFLRNMLKKTNKLILNETRAKVKIGGVYFITALICKRK